MAEELIRLSHPELQLLELVEEYGAWVAGIANTHEDSWGSANKWNFRYTPEVWAVALARLLEIGAIKFGISSTYAFKFSDDPLFRVAENQGPLVPTRDEILAELLRRDVDFDAESNRKPMRPVWDYRLTPLGGAAWEQFARPEWARYVEPSYSPVDPPEVPRSIGEITGGSREHVLECLSCMSAIGMKGDVSTVEWDEVSPWEIRYWKKLEVGYRARFAVEEEPAAFDYRDLPPRAEWCFRSWRPNRW